MTSPAPDNLRSSVVSNTSTFVDVSITSIPTPGEAAAHNAGSLCNMRLSLVFTALCVSLLLAALDLTSVGTAAPTILNDLRGEDFSWVSSAYSLASSACLPLSGNIAQVFGRRHVLLSSLVMFAIGSAVSGSARSMVILILGRAIQGMGGGSLQSVSNIIITDLVPLRKRGLFTGITGMIWTIGSLCGPFLAGGLSRRGLWRWLFYLNLPLCGLAIVVVYFCLQLQSPGLTWGGVTYPWSSPRVIVPLGLGIVGIASGMCYELLWAPHPMIPRVLLSNRTSLNGYIACFIHGMVSLSVAFYLPTYFQAVKVSDPVTSSVYFLPLTTTLAPFAIVQGLIVAKTGKYKWLNVSGWVLMVFGMSLFTTAGTSTSIGVLAAFQIIQGVAIGLLYCLYFPIMAPLPVSQNAAAVSLQQFIRAFSQAWGVAIGGTILQNELKHKLPSGLLAQFAENADLSYSLIPKIASLSQPMQDQVRLAFAESLRTVWIVMASLCGVGLLSSLFIRELPLRKTVDKKWGLSTQARRREDDIEGNVESKPIPVQLDPVGTSTGNDTSKA
ncbi:MFS general substrate transporter [Panus rudis PR-1116 ss-1]|nr:MFS general substrate transporter [Panus rudis PR-1116 ss-1]